ncbi:MAG: thiol peroxidase [Deltaproteobacteria bacterium]
MDRKVAFKGQPLTLVGRRIGEGQAAPPFTAAAVDLAPKSLADYKNRIKVLTSFPSLDTPVCDLQVKEFNKRAAGMDKDVVVIGISQDLPFAQKRFCDANKIDRVTTLSDYKTNSFGINYGLLIKELHLLARAVLILDKNDVIRYIQVVDEVTHAPDYEAVLKGLEAVKAVPAVAAASTQAPSRCVPCEAGTPPLTQERVSQGLQRLKGWELLDERKIKKAFGFKDFIEAKYFVDLVSVVAEEQGHHPGIRIAYNKVIITLSTHAVGGLTDNDFILARIVDEITA